MVICLVILTHDLGRFSPCSRIPYSSPVTKIPVVHPLSIQQVAKCYSRNSFVFSMIHFDGRVYPWWFSLSRPQSPRPASPFPMPFLFTLLRTLLHFFALAKIPTPLFSRDSVLFGKKNRGVGVPVVSAMDTPHAALRGSGPICPTHINRGEGQARSCPLSKKNIFYAPCPSLFSPHFRIPVRMSDSISCLTPHRPAYLFCALMGDEAKSIVRGLQKRDPDLLDRLIEQYQYRLFRYLMYITGNKGGAEDFFQETWIRVLERGHQYDGKARFEAWLFAIARHLVIDWQRSKKAQSLDTLTDPEQEHPLQLPTENKPSPLHQAPTHDKHKD